MEQAIQTNGIPSSESFDVDLNSLDAFNGAGNPSGQSEAGQPQNSNNNNGEPSFEIDDRFKSLPPEEARFRTVKSKYDRLESEHTKAIQDLELSSKAQMLLDKLAQDENLLTVFVNQVKPGLLPKRDLGQMIKQKIKAEFGEDYKPTMSRQEAERDDPGGTDWRYYRRLDSLDKELQGDVGETASTVKEYLEKQALKAQDEQKKAFAEIEEVKQKYKVSEPELKAVNDWAAKLKFEDVLKLHRFLRRFPTRTPAAETAPGFSPQPSSDRQNFLKGIFG